MGRDRGCNRFTENGIRVRTDVKEMRMTLLTVDHSKELENNNEREGNFNGFCFFFLAAWESRRSCKATGSGSKHTKLNNIDVDFYVLMQES